MLYHPPSKKFLLLFAIPTVFSIGSICNELQDTASPNNGTAYTEEVSPATHVKVEKTNVGVINTTHFQKNQTQSIAPKFAEQKKAITPPSAPPSYDMSWVNIYGKSTPDLLVKSWTVWRNSQGTDNYAVKALGEAVKSFPQEQRHVVLSEVLYKIENERDYYDFVKYNSELFEAAYAELEKGQEDLSEPSSMVLTALGRCRVKWHFKPLNT